MKKFIQSSFLWYVFFFQNGQIKRDGGSNKYASFCCILTRKRDVQLWTAHINPYKFNNKIIEVSANISIIYTHNTLIHTHTYLSYSSSSLRNRIFFFPILFSDQISHRRQHTMARYLAGAVVLLVVVSISAVVESRRDIVGDVLKLPSEVSSFFRPVAEEEDSVGTRWAVLIAGSNGYWNYRHQVKWYSLC